MCDDSRKIGHYRNSDGARGNFEPTGSREVCGFYDLANAYKLLAEDPWEEGGGFWDAGGYLDCYSNEDPVSALLHDRLFLDKRRYAVGMLAMD